MHWFKRGRLRLTLPWFFLLLFAVITSSQAAPIAAFSNPTTTVFINEIHYDNAGTDVGEAIEIAGPAGTDLSGWSIVRYNGSGGGTYDTADLIGVTLSNQQGGCGTAVINYPANGLQNGSPDGIALVDNGGAVVQFLSYEGSFAATNGPANGLTSTDIGVAESSSSPVGNSLQLSGSGSTYGDFVWQAAAPNTFGAPNTGQVFTCEGGGGGGTGSTTLVINEVDYDQPSTDTAEFIELKNVSAAAIDLSSYQLEFINGSNNSNYATIALSGNLAAGEYFVVCANAANTPECDLDVSPDTNLIQNGAPDAVALTLGGNIVDTLSYEGDVPGYTEGSSNSGDSGSTDYLGLSRFPDGTDTDNNSTDFSPRCITPGEANSIDSAGCSAPGGGSIGACGDAATLISAVQGSGLSSPLAGNSVVIEGIVTGDFQNNGQPDDGHLNGYYVQEEESDYDSDPATSEGIFVFGATDDVMVGDLVRVEGTVAEFVTSGGASSLTQISNVTAALICSSGNALPAATAVSLPVTAQSDFESFEGMRVIFPQALVISEYFNYDRFGEIVLALPQPGEDRPYQPTAVVEPGAAANALQASNDLRRITLDDGQSSQNPSFVRHPNGAAFTLSNNFRGGDTVANSIGVIDDTFGIYRIQPTAGADYTSVNPRPTAPDSVGGSLKVSSFNVLNYFLTLDNSGSVCGPNMDQGCRGADNAEEFTRQRDKIISALAAIEADVFGLIELENTTGVEPLADIVDGLNAIFGAGTYDYIDTGTIGTDAIKVGIIYKATTVSPVGSYAILDSSVDPRFNDDKNRPVLAQSFMEQATGGLFTMAVNHLKSKGSDCNDVGDPDLGDGQGNCNVTRLLAAQALVDWAATDPTGSGDPDFLIVGDLNSYDKEDPIDAIKAGADDTPGTADDYTDLILAYQGEFAYSYVFSGQFGYLDHALANASLTPQVTGVTEWHINADEPDLIDYDTSFKSDVQDALYAPDAFRSSDHDPVIVGLDLNGSPVCSSAAPSEASLWPPNHKFVKINVLGVTDPEGDALNLTIDSIFQDEALNAPGSGNTAPDGQGIGTDTAEVRAERMGDGNGRVYHISFTATDAFGGSCSGTVQVSVPVSKMSTAVDDGPLYDSTVVP